MVNNHATIPGSAFIDFCAANAAETFRRRQADASRRALLMLEARRQRQMVAVAQARADRKRSIADRQEKARPC